MAKLYYPAERMYNNRVKGVCRMDLKEKALYVCDALEKEYPLAECTLIYEEAWQLMISVRLAAQCTDARVDIVTAELFKKYPSPKAEKF